MKNAYLAVFCVQQYQNTFCVYVCDHKFGGELGSNTPRHSDDFAIRSFYTCIFLVGGTPWRWGLTACSRYQGLLPSPFLVSQSIYKLYAPYRYPIYGNGFGPYGQGFYKGGGSYLSHGSGQRGVGQGWDSGPAG